MPQKRQEIEIPALWLGEGSLPAYQTAGASGIDLTARIETSVEIAPGATALIPTGLRIAIPVGYEAQVRPRSGLAAKKAVTVLNTPGTIDDDFRGEVGVILINHGRDTFEVKPNDRIAQLVFAPVVTGTLLAVTEEAFNALKSDRGQGGFGSTGMEKSSQ